MLACYLRNRTKKQQPHMLVLRYFTMLRFKFFGTHNLEVVVSGCVFFVFVFDVLNFGYVAFLSDQFVIWYW